MSKIKIKLSSTALGNSGCMLRFNRVVVQGYKNKLAAARLIYGISVHKYIDTMFKTGGNIALAVGAARLAFTIPRLDDPKLKFLNDERHMLGTCMNVWASYVEPEALFEVIMLGDKPATEQTFEILFYEDEFIVVYLCGTIDKIGQFKGGCYAIGDWKTTSSWDTISYFKQYEMTRQLRFYTLACKIMAQREPDSILGKIGSTKMGAFIDAIFLKDMIAENEHKRSQVFMYSNEEIAEFNRTVRDFCELLSNHVRDSYYPKQGITNGSCEGKWGMCDFWNVCARPQNIGELLLKRDFKQVEFDPANYNDL